MGSVADAGRARALLADPSTAMAVGLQRIYP